MTVPANTDLAFRDRAAAEALLDVAYDLTDSPIGPPARRRHRARPLRDRLRPRSRGARSSASRACTACACSARRAPLTKLGASSTSTSRAAGTTSTSRST